MDILRFINSRDIREHLKTIHYQFNSLEAAWLIYQDQSGDGSMIGCICCILEPITKPSP